MPSPHLEDSPKKKKTNPTDKLELNTTRKFLNELAHSKWQFGVDMGSIETSPAKLFAYF